MTGKCNLPERCPWGTRVDEPQFEVSFTLVEGTCVYADLYEEYAVSDLEEAVTRVAAAEGNMIFPRYRVYMPILSPKFEWFATWPLRRRGNASGLQKINELDFDFSENEYADDTLLEFWERPNGVWGLSSTLMLRVGGRTGDEAVSNWQAFAHLLRRAIRKPKARQGDESEPR